MRTGRFASPAPRFVRLVPALSTASIFALASAGAALAGTAFPAIIDNGTIMLGVDTGACLNVSAPAPAPEGFEVLVGLRDLGTGLEGVGTGANPFEGWGVADLQSTAAGGAVSDIAPKIGGTYNLTLVGFGVSGSGTQGISDGRSMFTVHEVGPPVVGPSRGAPTMRVRHEFRPSGFPRLYEIEVTIENLMLDNMTPRYRRLVDWSAQPSPDNEYVTLRHGPSTAVKDSAGWGYQSYDPQFPLENGLSAPEGAVCGLNQDLTDCGPGNVGAAFDFQFPNVAPGGKVRFFLYYGAATSEADALSLLDAAGASAYALGQSSHIVAPASDGDTRSHGTPVTFVLGFKAPWAIVDNGTVELGIDMYGSLNVHGGTESAGSGPPASPEGAEIFITGLRNVATNFETLAGGTPREGWGVADLASKTGSGTTSMIPGSLLLAPEPEGDPPTLGFNMSPVNFEVFGDGTLDESVGRRAIVKTVIDDPPILRVIHDFRPSKVPELYEVVVVLENVSGAPITPRYRRIADWDVEPTPLSELVTIEYPDPTPLVPHSAGNGFSSPNPLDAMSGSICGSDVPFEDCGPNDLGMALDFAVDEIPVGGKEQFLLYYGSAFGEKAALAALAAVGASEIYSFGEPSEVLSPEIVPPLYIFAFRDVLFVDDFETGDASRWSNTAP